MNKIKLSKFVVQARIGVGQEERMRPQPLKLKITIYTNSFLLEAAVLDELEFTVDYSRVKKTAERLVEKDSFCLLETLAFRLARQIMEMKGVVRVKVKVAKLEVWSNCVPAVYLEL